MSVIHPVSFVCARDWSLYLRLMDSLHRFCSEHSVAQANIFVEPADADSCIPISPTRRFQQPKRFKHWPSWPHVVSELRMLDEISDPQTIALASEDYLFVMDSDFMFCAREFFDAAPWIGYDYCGMPSSETYSTPRLDNWRYFSGSFRIFRVAALRAMLEQFGTDPRFLRSELSERRIPWMNDVVTSYLMLLSGAKARSLYEFRHCAAHTKQENAECLPSGY